MADDDEHAIRSEIALLEHQYAELRDEFKVLTSRRSAPDPPQSNTDTTQISANDLDAILSGETTRRGLELHNIQTESLHRFTGVTIFSVSNPGPADQLQNTKSDTDDARKLLGIRIESMVKGRFLAPYYIILKKRFVQRVYKGASSSAKGVYQKGWLLYRHTIPSFIDTEGLFADFCPSTNDPQGLRLFVKHIRRGLVYLAFRSSIFTSLPDDQLPSLIERVEADESYMSISLLLTNKKTLYLKCSTDCILTVTWSNISYKNYEVQLTRWLLGDIKDVWTRFIKCLAEWSDTDFADYENYTMSPSQKLFSESDNGVNLSDKDISDDEEEEGSHDDDDEDEDSGNDSASASYHADED